MLPRLLNFLKQQTSKNKRFVLGSLLAASVSGAIAGVATVVVIVSAPQPAAACRDCPFPMKIAEDTWLMPNKQLEVEISEQIRPRRTTETIVTVKNARTKEILAWGSVVERSGKRILQIALIDSNGNRIMAEIEWMDSKHDSVSIELSCIGDCAISPFLDRPEAN